MGMALHGAPVRGFRHTQSDTDGWSRSIRRTGDAARGTPWPAPVQPAANPSRSPRSGAHCAATAPTRPGRRDPEGCSPSKVSSTWQVCLGPSTTTSTRPSARLLADPRRPSARACERTHQRKPTAWTSPETKAVRRTAAELSIASRLDPVGSPATVAPTVAPDGVAADSVGTETRTGS